MTREEQEQAFNRRVKQNNGGAVGEAAQSTDEQTSNGQSYKTGISNATNAIVTKDDEPAVSNVKQPATQSTLIDADTQQANKENAIDKLLQSRIEANNTEQQKLEENYQAQQKRQKRNAIISSIADGLSALSNMYFVSKGAPTPTRQAASMSEQQAKQNVADRNTYLELLQGWRKRNNELLNNYATYQATAVKNKLTQQRLAFEQDREARLYAEGEAQRAYQEKLIELKQKNIDDARAKWQAQLAYNERKLQAQKEYWRMQDATANRRIDVQAAPVVKKRTSVVKNDMVIPIEERTERELN